MKKKWNTNQGKMKEIRGAEIFTDRKIETQPLKGKLALLFIWMCVDVMK